MSDTGLFEGVRKRKELYPSLADLMKAVFRSGLAMAAWRKPGEEEINVIVDLSGDHPRSIHPDLETLSPGFLVSPFLNESNLLSYLIRADLHWKGKNGKYQKKHHPASGNPDARHRSFINLVDEIKESDVWTALPSSEQDGGREYNEEKFKKMIRNGIEEIRSGNFIKVVPSRRKKITLSEKFNPADIFNSLVKIYPSAFVSFFTMPGKGTWMGATPELIIRTDKNGIFHTAAVAGTQAADPGDDPSSVAWTQKEIEEQALVSRYIINCFKKIRLREFEEYGPKTIQAGNLMHLRTDFKVDIQAVKFPRLGSVMLKLLHPTSAVCGMPKEQAMHFIREQEGYDREFYSGYLGPVNMDQETELYVNLRCARLFPDKAYLYSGAGVTIDSDPYKEWKETVIKNRTMENLLSGIA